MSRGEHPNGRRAMRDLQRRLRESGYSSKKAEDKARQIAQDQDRRRNGQPVKPPTPSRKR